MSNKRIAIILLILAFVLLAMAAVMIFLGLYGIFDKDIKGYYQFLSFLLFISGLVMGYIGFKQIKRHRKIVF